MLSRRRFYRVEQELRSDGYGAEWKEEVRHVCPPAEADLVGSRDELVDLHWPVFDVDLPVQAIPSATEGHYHLYIDKPMSWRAYKRLLRAMVKAGIVEKGYYQMARKRGETFVRTPEKPKPFSPDLVLYEDGTAWQRPKIAPRIRLRRSSY